MNLPTSNLSKQSESTTWLSRAPSHVPICLLGSLCLTSCCTFWTWKQIYRPERTTGEKRIGGWRKARAKDGDCQEAHSFSWVPSGSGKVDKQWRELHSISFPKPEQTHSHHNARAPQPLIPCRVPSIVRDWVLSIVGQILSRSVRQTKGGERTKMDESCNGQWETQMRRWLGATRPCGLDQLHLIWSSLPCPSKKKRNQRTLLPGELNETILGYRALCKTFTMLQLGNTALFKKLRQKNHLHSLTGRIWSQTELYLSFFTILHSFNKLQLSNILKKAIEHSNAVLFLPLLLLHSAD